MRINPLHPEPFNFHGFTKRFVGGAQYTSVRALLPLPSMAGRTMTPLCVPSDGERARDTERAAAARSRGRGGSCGNGAPVRLPDPERPLRRPICNSDHGRGRESMVLHQSADGKCHLHLILDPFFWRAPHCGYCPPGHPLSLFHFSAKCPTLSKKNPQFRALSAKRQ